MSGLKQTWDTVTKNIVNMSSGAIKNAKLVLELSGEEEKLKCHYIDIGKKVHEIYAYGGTIGPFFDEKYNQIAETEARIAELKKQRAETAARHETVAQPASQAKEGKTPEGQESAATAPEGQESPATPAPERPESPAASGAGMPTPAATPAPEAETTAPPIASEPVKKICSVCSAPNEAGEKFCLSCGRML